MPRKAIVPRHRMLDTLNSVVMINAEAFSCHRASFEHNKMTPLVLEADIHSGSKRRSHICGYCRDTPVMHNASSHSGSTMESIPDKA